MWRDRKLTLTAYADLCTQCDISVSAAPEFVAYHFSVLGLAPRLVPLRSNGSLVGAFASLYKSTFPTNVHKRFLGKSFLKLGDIGQTETLFPLLPIDRPVALYHFSPTTSPLLAGRVRTWRQKSLISIGIAKSKVDKRTIALTERFVAGGGKIIASSEMSPKEFADIYLELHSKRWGYDPADLDAVRKKIIALYPHVYGTVLTNRDEPVAAQLCFRHIGRSIFYVDFTNAGVKHEEGAYYGNILMYSCLRRAKLEAQSLNKTLRHTFGYPYEPYKKIWAEFQPTFVGI
jgi:hypothetical protein